MTTDWIACICGHLGVNHAANGPCAEFPCECAEFEATP